MSGYADAAQDYLNRGWHPLPVLDNAKGVVPIGFTGYAARPVEQYNVDRWVDLHQSNNLCLRLMDEVGLDMDNYRSVNSKEVVLHEMGDAERWLAEKEAELGSLPQTVKVSSRLESEDYDGLSGILLYRLPKEVRQVAESRVWHSKIMPAIDVIRLGHRQVVSWPSIHPSRKTEYAYCWTHEPTVIIHGPLPAVDELPELPPEWCALLLKPAGRQALGWEAAPEEEEKPTRKERERRGATAPDPDTDEEGYSHWWSEGEICEATQERLDHWIGEMAENSRYDSVRNGVLALTRMGEQGHLGVMGAVEALKQEYRDSAGSERDIEGEWERMCVNLDDLIADDPTPNNERGCCIPTWGGKPISFLDPSVAGASTGVRQIEGMETLDTSDLGLALWFLWEHRDEIRWVTDIYRWMVWDGTFWDGKNSKTNDTTVVGALLSKWLSDRCEAVGQAVCESTLRAVKQASMHGLADNADNREKADTAAQKAAEKARNRIVEQLRTATKFKSVLSMVMVRGPQQVGAMWSQFDAIPHLINCPNGVVDLRSKTLLPHDRELMMTMNTPVDYRPEAECPSFLKSLLEAQPDPDVRDYLQRRAGMILYGLQREHLLHVDYGERGRNGKGLHAEALFAAMGEYAGIVASEKIMAQKHDPHSEWVFRLRGKRLTWVDELREQRSMDTAKVKQLTGGAPRECRDMRGSTVYYSPHDTWLLTTNRVPQFDGGDEAMAGRLRVVNWDQSFLGREDLDLKEKATTEDREGVLAWMVEGAEHYIQDGRLNAPLVVVESSEDVIRDADPVATWATVEVEVDPDIAATTYSMHKRFLQWLKDNDPEARKPAAKKFSRDLKAHLDRQGVPYSKKKVRVGSRTLQAFDGISLTESAWNDVRFAL